MSCIIDASTLLKSAADEEDEEGAGAARTIQPPLAEKFGFRAPGLIDWEVANVVLYKLEGPEEGTLEEKVNRVETLLSGIERVPNRGIDWKAVGRLSEDHGLTACDASYLFLALADSDPLLLTEDESLLEAGRTELGVDRAHDAVTALHYIKDGRF